MEIFGGMGEAIIIMVVVVGCIFALLVLLHVITDVYMCNIPCIKDKIKAKFWKFMEWLYR